MWFYLTQINWLVYITLQLAPSLEHGFTFRLNEGHTRFVEAKILALLYEDVPNREAFRAFKGQAGYKQLTYDVRTYILGHINLITWFSGNFFNLHEGRGFYFIFFHRIWNKKHFPVAIVI